MGMGVARTAFDKFPDLELFFGVSWVHYQPIPGAKPFEFNCSGIFARLTALYSYTLNVMQSIPFRFEYNSQALKKTRNGWLLEGSRLWLYICGT